MPSLKATGRTNSTGGAGGGSNARPPRRSGSSRQLGATGEQLAMFPGDRPVMPDPAPPQQNRRRSWQKGGQW